MAACQYPRQLPEAVWQAMSGNVGSKIVLRQEEKHAETCTDLLGKSVAAANLAALPDRAGVRPSCSCKGARPAPLPCTAPSS